MDDVEQRLRDDIAQCRANDGTWERLDDGKLTPHKIAIAWVLWPRSEKLGELTSDPPQIEQSVGPELWGAIQRIQVEQLAQDIEEEAERLEQKPSLVNLETNNWIKIAALQVLGYDSRCIIPEGATQYHEAKDRVRDWRDQFKTYGNYALIPELQSRIRRAFRTGSISISRMTAYARDPSSKESRSKEFRRLAADLKALADRVVGASNDASMALRRAVGGTDLGALLRAASSELLAEAYDQDRRAGAVAALLEVKQGRGKPKKTELHFVISELADVWESMTGEAADANFQQAEGDRQTPFVRFAHEMCERADRKDLGGSIEGTAPAVLAERRKLSRKFDRRD